MNSDLLFDIKIEDQLFTFVDVETTGLSPRYDKIIEVGIVQLKNFEIINSYNTFVNPGTRIPNFITNLTGITDDDVYDAPFFEDVRSDLINYFEDSVVVGHNVKFDISFLTKEFQQSGVENFKPLNVCTVRMARRLYPHLKSRSLPNLAKFFRLHQDFSHRAIDDIIVTSKIFTKMCASLKKENAIYSVGELLNFQHLPRTKAIQKIVHQDVLGDFANLPAGPGIYFFINSKGEVIYIGKAKSLSERIRSYITGKGTRKGNKIIKQARKIRTRATNSELTALLAEAEMIKIILPKHNYQLKSYGDKYFLKLNLTHKFPSLTLTNKFEFDGNDYYGLFISRKKAEQISEIIDKSLALRECSDKEFKKGTKCFLYDIERCTAPCISSDKILYDEEVEKFKDFMRGNIQGFISRHLNKMKEYSQELKFERAAEQKEIVDLLLNQVHKTSLLSEPVNEANILIEVTGYNNKKDFLLMLKGKIFIRNNIIDGGKNFEIALEDYFSGTIFNYSNADEEDLEKMKIILNWLIKNRNFVKIYYLKNFNSISELEIMMSKNRSEATSTQINEFEIQYQIAEQSEQSKE